MRRSHSVSRSVRVVAAPNLTPPSISVIWEDKVQVQKFCPYPSHVLHSCGAQVYWVVAVLKLHFHPKLSVADHHLGARVLVAQGQQLLQGGWPVPCHPGQEEVRRGRATLVRGTPGAGSPGQVNPAVGPRGRWVPVRGNREGSQG